MVSVPIAEDFAESNAPDKLHAEFPTSVKEHQSIFTNPSLLIHDQHAQLLQTPQAEPSAQSTESPDSTVPPASAMEPLTIKPPTSNVACAERKEPRAKVLVPHLAIGTVGHGPSSPSSGSASPANPRMLAMVSAYVEAQGSPPRYVTQGSQQLVQMNVDALQADNTLGLLLNGVAIVGFRILEAKDVGWNIGDKIVEVNGECVSCYDQFMERFRDAQKRQGFPIRFGVLRREGSSPDVYDAEATAEDTLHNFFNTTDFELLTGRLQDGLPLQSGESNSTARDAQGFDGGYGSLNAHFQNYAMEHPFVTALKHRRDALVRGNAGWSKWSDDDFADTCDTVASRLARRQDGVSTLHISREEEEPSGYAASHPHKACSWFCSPGNIVAGSRFVETVDLELIKTPRVDRYEPVNSRFDVSSAPDWMNRTPDSAAPLHRTAASSDCCDPNIAKPTLMGPSSLPDSLVTQLMASNAFNFTSDDEDDDCEIRPGGMLTPKTTGVAVHQSDGDDDLGILLPRRQVKEANAYKGTLHESVQAQILGQTSV